MGFERIPDTDVEYGLISFDADGKERPEGATLMSQQLIEKAKREGREERLGGGHGRAALDREEGPG